MAEKIIDSYINNIWMFIKSGQDKSAVSEIGLLKKELKLKFKPSDNNDLNTKPKRSGKGVERYNLSKEVIS